MSIALEASNIWDEGSKRGVVVDIPPLLFKDCSIGSSTVLGFLERFWEALFLFPEAPASITELELALMILGDLITG